jgi:sialic acid synthase SpsE
LIITQDDIIKNISETQGIESDIVRNIFKSAEKLIFNYLSSATPTDNISIKLLDGLSLECNYIPEREIHTYDVIKCGAKIWTKPKVTRYYNRKLNGYFAGRSS